MSSCSGKEAVGHQVIEHTVVLLRLGVNDQIEVYLVTRGGGLYAGKLQCPTTVVGCESAFLARADGRIAEQMGLETSDLNDRRFVGKPRYWQDKDVGGTHFCSLAYLLVTDKDPDTEKGGWYAVSDSLENDAVLRVHRLRVIPDAVKLFLE